MVYITLDEPWHKLVPTYQAAATWACHTLGLGNQRACLVIGSPLGEVSALQRDGWHVTYLDIRVPPAMPKVVIKQGDACRQPFDDASFDAISSTCVLCHVGTGRYGDALDADGPRQFVAECQRVLKPGGILVMMVGPVSTTAGMVEKHRVTSLEQTREWIQQSGFIWLDHARTKGDTGEWTTETTDGYLCVACEHP